MMAQRAGAALLWAGLGALVALGQAPLGWVWATLPALALLFARLPRLGPARQVGGAMWLSGSGYFAASLFWIVEPFLIEPEIYGWMAPFALVGMAGGMAIFWALAGWGAASLATGGARVALVGLALVALELARGHVFGGFPWAMLGHSWIDTPLIALGAYFGAGGLSLLTVFVALAIALPRTWFLRAGAGAGALALLAPFWVWGTVQSSLPPDRGPVVRLAQPNAIMSEKWDGDNAVRYFFRLLYQTDAPAETPPALVVWPETAVDFLLENPGNGLTLMADALAAQGPEARLVFGVQRLQDQRFFNALAVLTPEAEIAHIYDKHHLVPFGEYVPLAEWITGTRLAGFAGQALLGYSPGPGPVVLDLGPAGEVLPLICYEAIFPRHTRTETRPDWILQITNDGWFGELTGPYQHLAQARLRAVETGLPLIRVANTGVSAVIDARGGVVAEIPLGAEGFLDAAIPGALPPTFYSRWGDGPVWLLLVLLAGGMLMAPRTRRSSRAG